MGPDNEENKKAQEEDEYDEDADSDFTNSDAGDSDVSSSSDDEGNSINASLRTKSKVAKHKPVNAAVELDSGDEATIKEQEKRQRRQRRKSQDPEDENYRDAENWRARTRAMRAHDKIEKKRNKLASVHASTIDVDKIWEEMNKPGPLPPVRMEGDVAMAESSPVINNELKNPDTTTAVEEMITIKRKFKFAGEVHTEEKTLSRDSAEAQLWLAQQRTRDAPDVETATSVQRPLRKVSRFDPNYNNLAAFKTTWARSNPNDTFKGPKLNVVEKSKIDWAAHVDTAGLKDELAVHAKAKEGYHNRMDFLNQVELRKEEQARAARQRQA